MADISTLIFEELKREITTLKVIPGGRISEADICERFSVTRPPVRTAFQRLQDIGLLETVPYKGARATLISLSSVHQMIFLRTAVESQIIRDFMSTDPTPFEIEELEHNLRIQKLHINEKEVDEKEFFRLDCEMHQFWFDKMRCSEVWKMIQSDINYERFRMLDFVGTLGYQEIVRSHEKLLDVIKNKEISKITPILSEHLNAGLARMGNLIRTDYKQYFILDDQDNDYWVSYNKKINSGK
ncbi:MAG: GntR family transcriptional regulator [Bullifex sp.]|nr:GntR family transcriptional regulator [Bullifex sp.]